jgi:hypothetical protein
MSLGTVKRGAQRASDTSVKSSAEQAALHASINHRKLLIALRINGQQRSSSNGDAYRAKGPPQPPALAEQ